MICFFAARAKEIETKLNSLNEVNNRNERIQDKLKRLNMSEDDFFECLLILLDDKKLGDAFLVISEPTLAESFLRKKVLIN